MQLKTLHPTKPSINDIIRCWRRLIEVSGSDHIVPVSQQSHAVNNIRHAPALVSSLTFEGDTRFTWRRGNTYTIAIGYTVH